MLGGRLGHVAEGRVPVSQVLDLGLALAVEAVIALPEVALAVLPLAVRDAARAQDEDAELTRQVDGVAGVVLGAVFLDVSPAGSVSYIHTPRNA